MDVFFPLKNYSKVYWGTSSCIISFPYCVPFSHQTREAVGETETQRRRFLTALIVSWGHISVMINALAQIAGDRETWVTIRMTFFGTGVWSYSCVGEQVCNAKEGRQQRSTVRHQWRDSLLSPNCVRREIGAPAPSIDIPFRCSALLALKVTKGLTLTRFTKLLALSSI